MNKSITLTFPHSPLNIPSTPFSHPLQSYNVALLNLLPKVQSTTPLSQKTLGFIRKTSPLLHLGQHLGRLHIGFLHLLYSMQERGDRDLPCVCTRDMWCYETLERCVGIMDRWWCSDMDFGLPFPEAD